MSVEAWERGSWMQTYTGRAFYPLAALVEDIDPLDIAHSLALQCRYNGHVERFYSVAEHCVVMSRFVAPRHALWALLHDATEAYVGDMVRPLKNHMPAYREAEDRLMVVIAERFGLAGAIPAEVKAADNRVLLDERAALMPPSDHQWMQDTDGTQPLGVRIVGWEPQRAEAHYLARLAELGALS